MRKAILNAVSRENADLVREMLSAWNRGDYAQGVRAIDPDVAIEVNLGFDVDGFYRGHAGLAELLKFWGAFGSFHSDIEEITDSGEEVFAELLHHGVGKTSGIGVEMRNWQVFTVLDGRITRYRLFGTRPQALEAAGLAE